MRNAKVVKLQDGNGRTCSCSSTAYRPAPDCERGCVHEGRTPRSFLGTHQRSPAHACAEMSLLTVRRA